MLLTAGNVFGLTSELPSREEMAGLYAIGPATLPLVQRVLPGSIVTENIQLFAYNLTEAQNVALDKAVNWSTLSLIALGANTASGLIALAGAPVVGGISGILSLGFWTLSTGVMAFGHRDLYFDPSSRQTDLPLNTIPFFSAVGAASFGMGAITALGMVFTDSTGVAVVLAGVCGGISTISGIVSIITTRIYNRNVR